MKKQPEYTYERDGGIWTIIRWRKNRKGNGYVGEKMCTCIEQEDARFIVYKLNGWKYKS